MAEVKAEEIAAHPPMDQLQGLEYCIDSNPSWGALGFVLRFLHLPFEFVGVFRFVPDALGRRGGHCSRISALCTGSGHGGDDSDPSCSIDGWK